MFRPMDNVSVRRASVPFGLNMVCKVAKTFNDLVRRKDGTLNRKVADLMEYRVPDNGKPIRGVYTKDIIINTETGVWVRLFIPTNMAEQLPIVFYFHGGGFAVLSAASIAYDAFCRTLARSCRVIVISVDYRRAPEYKCPIAYEDSFGALAWLRSDGHTHLPQNTDISCCFLMGDSAGGNIVHHVGCRAVGGDAELIRPVRIVGLVLIQPYFGGERRTVSELKLVNAPLVSMENSDWYWRAFLPEGANKDYGAANVFGPNGADISGLPLPPALVVVGGHDPLQDWQIGYVENLKKLKKDVQMLFYEEGIHAFHLFYWYPLADQFISDFNEFKHKLLMI
eukprot:Gb_10789 [translate_table: standard]